MVSSLNPFKQAPLHVANTTADDSASESEQLLEEETKASDSSSVRTSRSTILGSLNSLAGGGKKDPVTPESIQPSDIKSLLELQTFFFSTGPWNLTLRASQQSQNETDDRFFWNKAAVKPLADVGLTVAPLIQGFVEVRESVSMSSETSASPESTFDFALISRRSKYRAGFRYERRGVDEQGHVANFVETEMVVFTKESKVASFLQIRGSIPLYWTQVASTKTLNPTPSLDRSDEENLAALRLHVEELEKLYQAVVVVDLVGKEGREEPLGTRFKTLLQQVSTDHPTITYKDYDFHKETKGLNYDNLKHLLDLLSTDFTTVSHYSSTTGQDQTGVIRTNCMDCLDRTNVVQSIL
ncbi:Phosphatidylinositide phosphatase SAC2, partial [Rhizoclosmatium hyalinum]